MSKCKSCKYWSELIAKAQGDFVRALCLGEGSFKGQYMSEFDGCRAWKENLYGAVDLPPNYGEEPMRRERR